MWPRAPPTFPYLTAASSSSKPGVAAAPEPDLKDAEGLERTRAAMSAVGLHSGEEADAVWRVLSAILLLGQISFAAPPPRAPSPAAAAPPPASDAPSSAAPSPTPSQQDEHAQCIVGSGGAAVALTRASELLGVCEADLSRALTTRRLTTLQEEVLVHLSSHQALDSRDALAKALYGRLFSWLVNVCNTTIAPPEPPTSPTGKRKAAAAACHPTSIGVLDIFGFEIFGVNSFEQLCINYANEALQQHFCADVFRAEQALYASEGVPWEPIPFDDNAEVLSLLGRSGSREKNLAPGVLPLLDDECSIQSGTDLGFVQKLHKAHESHEHLTFPRGWETARSGSFTVKHYAGAVTYEAEGMRDKNRDTLHPDLSALMTHASGADAAFVQGLFSAEEKAAADAAAAAAADSSTVSSKRGRGGADRMSAGAQFVSSLNNLMRSIGKTTTHYVRCVKPSVSGGPLLFESGYVAAQLRSAGVLEAVRIARHAFPTRMLHGEMVVRFALLSKRIPSINAEMSAEVAFARCEALLEELLPIAVDISDGGEGPQKARYVLGKTKVFFRSGALEELEQRRTALLSSRAITLQRAGRRYSCRRNYIAKKEGSEARAGGNKAPFGAVKLFGTEGLGREAAGGRARDDRPALCAACARGAAFAGVCSDEVGVFQPRLTARRGRHRAKVAAWRRRAPESGG